MQFVFMSRLTGVKLKVLSFESFFCQVDRRCAWQSFVLTALAIVFQCLPLPLQAKPPRAEHGLVWEASIEAYAPNRYSAAVNQLLASYETSVGVRLQPGERGKVALKVDTRSGRGMATPLALVRAVIDALEQRSFSRDSIMIVGATASDLRQIGLLPPLSQSGAFKFAGCEVLAWDSNLYQDPEWFYDSPLPPAMREKASLFESFSGGFDAAESVIDRKSFLPMPLLFEVDFWINLATGVDAPALGVDGVLASATLWNVSNSQRFLANPAAASAAVAEIAAIPELAERWILNFVSLESYQYIGGPAFNSQYTRSEPKLWLSSDPVALDRLLYERFNRARRLEGFPEIDPLPRQFVFAASLGLGVYEKSQIRIQVVGTAGGSNPTALEIITLD